MTYDPLYFDCLKCHGIGCDVCGGIGKSNEPIYRGMSPNKMQRIGEFIEILLDKKIYLPKNNHKLMAELDRFVYPSKKPGNQPGSHI